MCDETDSESKFVNKLNTDGHVDLKDCFKVLTAYII